MSDAVRNVLVEEEGQQKEGAIGDERRAEDDENGARPSVKGGLTERNQVERARNQAPDDSAPDSQQQKSIRSVVW